MAIQSVTLLRGVSFGIAADVDSNQAAGPGGVSMPSGGSVSVGAPVSSVSNLGTKTDYTVGYDAKLAAASDINLAGSSQLLQSPSSFAIDPEAYALKLI